MRYGWKRRTGSLHCIFCNISYRNSFITITCGSADIASDDRLVFAGIRIKFREIHGEVLNRRFDMERLKDDTSRDCFRTQLDKRWKQTKDGEMKTAEETWGEIRAIYIQRWDIGS